MDDSDLKTKLVALFEVDSEPSHATFQVNLQSNFHEFIRSSMKVVMVHSGFTFFVFMLKLKMKSEGIVCSSDEFCAAMKRLVSAS